mmetsp:Transcript_19195/g.57929  ORF Transcript_19195/g.57929 Transcript_19195/m.57929 type:complete len:105 (+) Transcript_19195:301-615(+)|eukprot:CAMPEP_0206151018 /NCGR_PEP_ID=MMETSP1473-20131121/38604_1 /ASSEMBLY_ACC=CAM_ASM_001109 /TAXON_ID=1461547 /ORGANISM="Stichococcus sp, Strain RCC1054" /LENGTH=104 /DNA_ID=CAMNT_0053548553 /DNA_START=273 /DNA_END=587 /DNA_ORIENTATION=+
MADEDPTQAAREDVKPEPGAAGEEPTHLNLKVKAQDGNVVFFKAKPTTPFRKLMNAYCAKSSIDVETVNFMFDGVRLRGEQTPASVDMEDQDEIQVVIHQIGGQ